jgi:hypothetical protein
VAATIVFTETPYQGIEDSPFAQAGKDFHLEDFEDGQFDLPGLHLKDRPVQLLPKVYPPAVPTRSVESPGHSFGPTFEFITPSIPSQHSSTINFIFDHSVPAAWRHEIGFVLTSAPEGSSLSITAFGADGNHLGVLQKAIEGLDVPTFFGVASESPIEELQIRVALTGERSFFHIDHLQYAVPEPDSLLLAAMAATSVLLLWKSIRTVRMTI